MIKDILEDIKNARNIDELKVPSVLMAYDIKGQLKKLSDQMESLSDQMESLKPENGTRNVIIDASLFFVVIVVIIIPTKY